MRLRLICSAVLVCLLGALSAQSAPPTAVIQVKSLDALIEDARYLAHAAGKGELADQGEKFLKSLQGPKGLAGIDTTRPIAVYGQLEAAIPESPFAVMLPVADE